MPDQGQIDSGEFQLWHLINFCFGLVWPGLFFVFTQTYVREVTGSAADAGLIMAVIGLGALAAPVFGGLADRYRAHRPIQILSFSIVLAGILIMAYSEDEMFFVLAAILVGVGLAPASMITNVYAVAAGLSQEAEARAIGSLQRMLFAGTIIGGFAVAGLLQLQKEGHLSWSTLFLICAGVVGLGCVCKARSIRRCRRSGRCSACCLQERSSVVSL